MKSSGSMVIIQVGTHSRMRAPPSQGWRRGMHSATGQKMRRARLRFPSSTSIRMAAPHPAVCPGRAQGVMPRQREAPERLGGPAAAEERFRSCVCRGRWKRLMPGQPPWPAHSRRQPADQPSERSNKTGRQHHGSVTRECGYR